MRVAIVALLLLAGSAVAADKPVKVNPKDVIHGGSQRCMKYDGKPVVILCDAEVKNGILWLFDGQVAAEVPLIQYAGPDMPRAKLRITGTADVQFEKKPFRLTNAKVEKP